MAVEASQIANLLAIAKYGSFTRAAEEKGISQPALSNSIALLEQRLGVRVLERTRRGSTLTPYGEILARRAEGVLSLLSDAETEVKRRAAGVDGPLRIGATPSVLSTLLPRALRPLLADSGPVDIEIVDGLDDALVPMLRSGAIDIIIGPVAEMFGSPPDILEHVLMRDPFALAVGPDSGFFERDQVSLAELSNAKWVLPRPGSTYRRHVEALFMTRGIAWPQNCILANSLSMLESLVKFSGFVTVVSLVQIAEGNDDFKVITLQGGGFRSIGYKLRRNMTPSPILKNLCSILELELKHQ